MTSSQATDVPLAEVAGHPERHPEAAVDAPDPREEVDLLVAEERPGSISRGIAFAVLISAPFWALLAVGAYLLL